MLFVRALSIWTSSSSPFARATRKPVLIPMSALLRLCPKCVFMSLLAHGIVLTSMHQFRCSNTSRPKYHPDLTLPSKKLVRSRWSTSVTALSYLRVTGAAGSIRWRNVRPPLKLAKAGRVLLLILSPPPVLEEVRVQRLARQRVPLTTNRGRITLPMSVPSFVWLITYCPLALICLCQPCCHCASDTGTLALIMIMFVAISTNYIISCSVAPEQSSTTSRQEY